MGGPSAPGGGTSTGEPVPSLGCEGAPGAVPRAGGMSHGCVAAQPATDGDISPKTGAGHCGPGSRVAVPRMRGRGCAAPSVPLSRPPQMLSLQRSPQGRAACMVHGDAGMAGKDRGPQGHGRGPRGHPEGMAGHVCRAKKRTRRTPGDTSGPPGCTDIAHLQRCERDGASRALSVGLGGGESTLGGHPGHISG